MVKRIISASLALLMAAMPAWAEVFTGTIAAGSTIAVSAEANGIVEEMYVLPGSVVGEGDVIARLGTTKVFAARNGTVSRIHAEEGDETDGTVMEVAPVSRYTIHCTADGAYDSAASNLVHCGEQLYIYCTKNGTHQGRGRVYAIDNETYMVEATAGEFYVGETVYLYRDADYSYKQRTGIGTVVSASPEAYESHGRIAAIHVAEGEYVEKGELLYEVIDGSSAVITAPADGIVTAYEIGKGDSVKEAQTVCIMVSSDAVCAAVQMDENHIGQVAVGDPATLTFACLGEDHPVTGTVTKISYEAQDGCYIAWISSEETPPHLGMTVQARIEN